MLSNIAPPRLTMGLPEWTLLPTLGGLAGRSIAWASRRLFGARAG